MKELAIEKILSRQRVKVNGEVVTCDCGEGKLWLTGKWDVICPACKKVVVQADVAEFETYSYKEKKLIWEGVGL